VNEVKCPHCGGGTVRNGLRPSGVQEYLCKSCGKYTAAVLRSAGRPKTGADPAKAAARAARKLEKRRMARAEKRQIKKE
jgi:transposase-like protein